MERPSFPAEAGIYGDGARCVRIVILDQVQNDGLAQPYLTSGLRIKSAMTAARVIPSKARNHPSPLMETFAKLRCLIDNVSIFSPTPFDEDGVVA